MSRKRVGALGAICCLSASGWLLAGAVAASARETLIKPTVITVIAGKPREFAFELSKFSSIQPGTISFVIKNQGMANHDFELCQTPVSNAGRNLCVGYQSQDLQPGQTTRITVVNLKKAKYEFLSTDSGDAAAGMKGLLGVGVTVKPRARQPNPTGPKPTVVITPARPATTTTPTTAPSPTPTMSDTTTPETTTTNPALWFG